MKRSLEQVGAVYAEARQHGLPTSVAVAEAFDTNETNARVLIHRARRAGLIPDRTLSYERDGLRVEIGTSRVIVERLDGRMVTRTDLRSVSLNRWGKN